MNDNLKSTVVRTNGRIKNHKFFCTFFEEQYFILIISSCHSSIEKKFLSKKPAYIMNAVMNETQVCYRKICDKTIDIKRESKHIFSKTHKHKKQYGIVVKAHNFVKPENDYIKNILNDTPKDCIYKCFHSFENRCVYDKKHIEMEKTKKLFYQLHSDTCNLYLNFMVHVKKIKNAGKISFRFRDIVKLPKKLIQV